MTDVPQRILGLLQASDRPLSKGKIALDLQLNLRTIEPHLRTLSKEGAIVPRLGFYATREIWRQIDSREDAPWSAVQSSSSPVASRPAEIPASPPKRYPCSKHPELSFASSAELEVHVRKDHPRAARPVDVAPIAEDPEPPAVDHPPAARRLMGLAEDGKKRVRWPYVVECTRCGMRRGKMARWSNWTQLRLPREPHDGVHEWNDVSSLYLGGKPPSRDRETRPDRIVSGGGHAAASSEWGTAPDLGPAPAKRRS